LYKTNKMIEKERILYANISKEDFASKFLEVLNGAAKLTQKERRVFLSFCDYYELNKPDNILDPSVRAAISDKLKMSSYNLNNTIAGLKRKSAIRFDSKNSKYYLNPLLVPSTEITQIRFIINYI